ncbi:MAG: HgcAB-like fusion protein [Planctomycetota bacterium]
MRARELPGAVFDTLFRLFPRRAPTGLVRIGQPGRGSPVLLTGNYTVTVRRLRAALQGHDAWLLVANSKGVNVWCAAGGGLLTHHDVISVLRTSGIEDEVDAREVVLPQLAATGVDRSKIEATGWTVRWGPARLEDLPAFLVRGGRVRKGERAMRFPLWERLEMSLIWTPGLVAVGAPLLGWLRGWPLALAAMLPAALVVTAVFLGLPWLRVTGRARWLTFGALALASTALCAGLLALLGAATRADLALGAATQAATMLLLSIDLTGTTPWYPSSVNALASTARIELVEDRCTGAAACVQVCPREVLVMDGRRRKVTIQDPEACIRCGACVVQCPDDALQFRYDDGRVVEPATIRRTRLNLMGKRAIEVREG